jgi:hypothetical protein
MLVPQGPTDAILDRASDRERLPTTRLLPIAYTTKHSHSIINFLS